MVDLIPNIGEVEARDDGGEGWALRVHVHSGEIVRAVLVRDYAGQVHYLLLGRGGEGSPSHIRGKIQLNKPLADLISLQLGSQMLFKYN